jgi:hypothetical protein
MTETEYWGRLEFRVSFELTGMPEKQMRRLWCDGFIAEEYLLAESIPRITGDAWVGIGSDKQEKWGFTLFLPDKFESVNEINWDNLLPRKDFTRWLTPDFDAKQLFIKPSDAAPDSD